MSADIQTSMNQVLKPEILLSQNKYFCPSYSLLCESTREICIINFASILIIQVWRFSDQGGQLVKNENFFSCTQSKSNKDLTVMITKEDEISFKISILWLRLLTIQTLCIGVITGLLSRTYTPLFGTLVMTSQFFMLKNIMSTILHHTSFFTEKFKFFPGPTKYFHGFAIMVISDIVFGCDDPTYNVYILYLI